MKKILIILGVIIILLLGAVWTYIFVYGVPENSEEIFANFGQATDRGDTPSDTPPTEDAFEGGDGEEPWGRTTRLYQLTTRPVAGAGFVDDGIRYVERGTGHIYEIKLQGGEEKIVSGTTIEHAVRASFSPNGDRVIITSDTETGLITLLGKIAGSSGNGSLTVTELPNKAREAAFSGETLRFFVPTANGGTGYSYAFATEKTTELFSSPLSQVRILWGKETYLYTTPSKYALGYVYKIDEDGISYVTKGGHGLMALRYATGTIVTTTTENGPETQDVIHGEVPLLTMIPEKCDDRNGFSRYVFCATPLNVDAGIAFPDDWYKGVVGYSDAIVRVNSASSSATVLSNLEEESGRPLDVRTLGVNANADLIYFINKYDNTLWLLDLRTLL